MKQSPYPIIVCGDFNDTPVSYTYNKIKGNLMDSFKQFLGLGLLNFMLKYRCYRIDYIMHDKKSVIIIKNKKKFFRSVQQFLVK